MMSLTMQMILDEDSKIIHIQINFEHHFATRVGGNPESKQRFQTHVMSDLVHDEPSEQFIFRATAIFDVFIGGVTN